MPKTKTFLQAEWRKLAVANYAVNPELVLPYVPAKTELDFWNNTCYVSLVGFMFLNTHVLGIKVPLHVNFEEVNLRFYVRYHAQGEWKRGVVFIKEIVPRAALTFVANTLYGEHYETMPMQHTWKTEADRLQVEYRWKKSRWNTFAVEADSKAVSIEAGSEAEFITEHYWGYTKIHAQKTSEYQVAHPRWEIYPVHNYNIDVDFGVVYGKGFSFLTHATPVSVFLAEGSEIQVKKGNLI
jgi:uncharacterized protein YqjF (DUF2071 family)